MIKLFMLFLILSACRTTEPSSEVKSDAKDQITNYGFDDHDDVSITLGLSGCRKKIWPYVVVRADYFVDSVTVGEMVAKQVYKFEYVSPVSSADGYFVKFFKQISGKDIATAITKVGRENFGNQALRTDKLLIDIYNNDTTFSSKDSILLRGIEISLPVKKVNGKSMYVLTSEASKSIATKLQEASHCTTAAFAFVIIYGG